MDVLSWAHAVSRGEFNEKIPPIPAGATDGDVYILQATVGSGGKITYSWELKS